MFDNRKDAHVEDDVVFAGLDPDLGVIDRGDLDDAGETCVSIPANLDSIEPGPLLAAVLSQIDPHRLMGHDRIVVLRARQRMASHYAAQIFDDMVAVADVVEADWDEKPASAADAAAAEIRAALNLTRRAADAELEMAIDLKRRLPRVWAALAAGDIDPRRARAIVHNTRHLAGDVGRDVVDQIVDEASNLTTGQIIAKLRRYAIEVAPEEACLRYQHAVDQRRVVADVTADGTSNLLGLDMPPDRVVAATRHINALARRMCGPNEARTIDQLRADIMLDLLNGQAIAGDGPVRQPRGVVDITVDLTTLADLNDEPGELSGYGPVIADIARRVVRDQHNATWRFAVIDPNTGRPLHTGVTRRRPTRSVERQVQVRNPRCVFPGCRVPARQSDLDHRIPRAEGGPTSVANLAPLCRHDHRVRHQANWHYELGEDGSAIWHSRLGHTYRTGTDPP